MTTFSSAQKRIQANPFGEQVAPALSMVQNLPSSNQLSTKIQRTFATLNVPGTYATIQAAVDAALPGDIISVAAGTYTGTINIEGKNNISIIGADRTTVIVKPSSLLCWNVSSYGCSRQTGFRIVGSTNINVSNVTFDFNDVKNNFVFGVLLWNSTGAFDNNEFKNLSMPDASGYYYELAVAARAPDYTDGSRAQISFTNNIFTDCGRVAINTHDFVYSLIQGNTFVKVMDDFGYALEIGSRSTAFIDNNSFSGYDTPALSDGSTSAGIYIENAFTGGLPHVNKPVTISNNNIYGNQFGMWIGNGYDGFAGDVDINVTLQNNNIHNNSEAGVFIEDEDRSGGSSVTVSAGGNTVSENGTVGYYLNTYGDGELHVSLSNDVVSGQTNGIQIEDNFVGSTTSLYDLAFHGNSIVGTSKSINNTLSTLFDASGNWLGSNTTSGVASAVSANIDYTPWLNSGTDTNPGTAGFQGDFSTLWVDDNCPQTGSTGRIQEGINLVSGSTVNIAAGTYTETVNLNKHIALLGAGSGSSGGTIITKTGGSNGVLNLSASGVSATDPILIKDIRLQPVGVAGISVGTFLGTTNTNVSYIKIDNVKIVGTNTNPCTEQERGLYVDLTSTLANLEIIGGSFENLTYGWYFQKQVSADASNVRYVTVTGTSFTHNSLKGIYAEKLADATFTDCAIIQNGIYDASMSGCSYFMPWMSGFDFNLKAGTYQNLTFTNCSFTNNGLGTNGSVGTSRDGVGLALKARGTGSDPSYATFPATLNNVTVTGGTFSGNERGIRVGEPGKNNATPTSVTIHNATITGNTKTYPGTDGSAYGGVVNFTQAQVNAEINQWGTETESEIVAQVYGSVDYDPWIGKPQTQTITNSNVNTPVDFAQAQATATFTSLPAGVSADVTIDRSTSLPVGIPDPPSTAGTVASLYLVISAPALTNGSFSVTITLDVSGIPNFNSTTEVMYYSTASSSWVGVTGTYDA
jgi:hypothetical protein